MQPITQEQHDFLGTALLKFGLELLDDQKSILVEKIKNVIVEMIHYTDEIPLTNFSDYLTEKLDYDYTYLSNLFSEVKGYTISKGLKSLFCTMNLIFPKYRTSSIIAVLPTFPISLKK